MGRAPRRSVGVVRQFEIGPAAEGRDLANGIPLTALKRSFALDGQFYP